jgi:hypothetical protein
LIETGLAAIWRHEIHYVLHAIETPERDLGLLSALLARIEREPFAAPRAQRTAPTRCWPAVRRHRAESRACGRWCRGPTRPTTCCSGRSRILLVKPQVAVAIDRWQRANGRAIGHWLRVVGDVEALSALATYAFERPADPFPEILDAGPLFEAEAVAHPLIPDGVSVPNDVRLGSSHSHAIVVSGSNMSGKSTLLRTVGVNVVLSLAGAPRARRSCASPRSGRHAAHRGLLQEGHSRFYNEILRLHIVQTRAAPLLFLSTRSCTGLIPTIAASAGPVGVWSARRYRIATTHDLALTELPSRLPGSINMHFEDRLENSRMVSTIAFVRVVEHSNAIASCGRSASMCNGRLLAVTEDYAGKTIARSASAARPHR